MIKLRICTGECKRELLETEEFFYFRKDRNCFKSLCKECTRKEAKHYRDNVMDKEKHKDYIKRYVEENKEKIKVEKINGVDINGKSWETECYVFWHTEPCFTFFIEKNKYFIDGNKLIVKEPDFVKNLKRKINNV